MTTASEEYVLKI